MTIYSIYLSLSKIFHLAGHPPSLSILLQMAKCLSLLWLNSVPLCIYYHILLIYLSIDGHLGCFIILAIIKTVAMNIGLKVFFQTNVFVLFRYMPRSGIIRSYVRSYVTSIFSFLRNFITVLTFC